MKKSILAFIILLLSLNLVTLSGCGQKKASEEEAPDETLSDVVKLSPQAVRQRGLTVLTVDNRQLGQDIVTTGEIAVNQNASFQVGAFTTGQILQDNVVLGDMVHRGQPLATLYNTDVAKINAQYIHEAHQNEVNVSQAQTRLALAQKTLQREKALYQEGISPRKDLEQAQTELTLAQTQLQGEQEHFIHLRSEAKALLGAYGTQPGSLHSEQVKATSPITAPRSGIVTKKNVTVGAIVTPGEVLYEVTDLDRVWLNIAIYPKDVALIHQGQTVQFTTDSLPGQIFQGQIDYIPPSANEVSQTFVARAFLNNAGLRLKPGMLGQTKIHLEQVVSKPFIPEEAVQTYGKEVFVFVPLGQNRYQRRMIQLGTKVDGGYFVQSGLQPGDTVVGKGSFTLKAAMLKSQFAGDED